MRWRIALLLGLFAGCAHGDPIVQSTSSSASSSGNGGWSTGDAGVGGAGGSTAAIGGGGGGAMGVCGDGIVDPGEECDDANGEPGDGCDFCFIECEAAAVKEPTTGHCYRVFAAALTWADAEANCKAWGGAMDLGHLVSIGDAAEQQFVAGLITENAWIGGDDMAKEGTYVWTDGTPWTYEHFAPNEPNDTTVEDCIFMRADGDWDDHDCAYKWPSYVCERRGAGTF